jgi:hypothetical protein
VARVIRACSNFPVFFIYRRRGREPIVSIWQVFWPVRCESSHQGRFVFLRVSPDLFWEWIPDMRPYRPISSSAGRRVSAQAESLELRTLLSGSSASKIPTGVQAVSIQVPSAYVSQQAHQFDVTLVRTTAAGLNRNLGSLTIDFSAGYGSQTASSATPQIAGQQFTPVHQSVTFPAGVATETVAVPVNAGAPNPGLVPVQLSVTSASRAVRGSAETIYLAASLDAVPPSIVAVQRVRGGIGVTFSKPMDPKSVTNIHNYAIKFTPTQKFALTQLTGVGLIQTLSSTAASIRLRRASYDSATDTVTLVPNEQLGSEGSYKISNPPSLLAKGHRPNKAHPLTDLHGNPLDQGGSHAGAFSITISKGHPYTATTAVVSGGQ